MECGKLTAKLRDAVPVCFIENGKEIKRFKNIEIPDEIKKLPYRDFEFSVPVTGAITFKIMFEGQPVVEIVEAAAHGSAECEWVHSRLIQHKQISAHAEVILPCVSAFPAVVKFFAFDLLAELFTRDKFRHEVHILSSMAVR